MNLQVLGFLIENESYIESIADQTKVDSGATFGIVKLLLASGGDLGKLSGKQTYHYENVIKPLLENVQCEGPIGMFEDDDGNWVSSCVSGGVIDDESLYQCYLEEDFKCQTCRYDSDHM
ncbi:hypothetical protein [Pseudidiomarina aestuarii]|uniref:hypothetical protein n=1 Tax=Pseudidiomarina aestuarii TaxID=624146 RepID=UPI003A97CCE8